MNKNKVLRIATAAGLMSALGHKQKADTCSAQVDVRFTPKADMCGALAHVRFVP